MEKDLASALSKRYSGEMVTSNQKDAQSTVVEVKRLNNLLVKVFFELDGQEMSFRAMLSEQREGILMLVQEKISDQNILSGVSGFLYLKPNVHGGYVHRLHGFYFHVMLDYFNGVSQEVYFYGKEEEDDSGVSVDPKRIFHTAPY
ncbi:MAG: hypothetical protein AAGA85_12525 [Bacteroidota bacterium]